MSTSDNAKGWVILIALGLGIGFGIGPFKHAACGSDHHDYSPPAESEEPATPAQHVHDDEPSFGRGTNRIYKCSNPSCFCKKYVPKGYYNTECECGDPKDWHWEFKE